MKLFITICLFCFLLMACKHNAKFTIQGYLDSADGTMISITDAGNTATFDSVRLKNKHFTLTTNLPGDAFYKLNFQSPVINHKGWIHQCLLYAENKAVYKFFATGPNAVLYNRYRIVSTSFEQQKIDEFRNKETALGDKYRRKKKNLLLQSDKLLKAGKKELYTACLDSLLTINSLVSKLDLEIRHTFISDNKETVYTPYLISQATDIFENYSLYKNALDNLSPDVKRSKYYDDASDRLKAAKAIYNGADVPILTGQDINGRNAEIDYQKSNFTLINFWASYCTPCREETPKLRKLYNTYKANGFNIISVSIDENPKYWRQASRQDSIPWLNIAELTQQEDSKNIKNFVVKIIPCNYLVNKKGQIVAKDISLDELERRLSQSFTLKRN